MGLGRRHGEGDVAAGDVAVHRQNLPADDVGAGGEIEVAR